MDLAQVGQAGKSACRTLGMLYAKLDQLLAAVMNNIPKEDQGVISGLFVLLVISEGVSSYLYVFSWIWRN